MMQIVLTRNGVYTWGYRSRHSEIDAATAEVKALNHETGNYKP